MQFIYTDVNGIEKGYLSNCSIDIEIGAYGKGSNDFEIEISYESWDKDLTIGSMFYCEGTEYGGIVTEMSSDTANELIKLYGLCPRSLLEQEFISPPTRINNYYLFNGEANAEISNYLETDKSIFSYNGNTTKTSKINSLLKNMIVVDQIGLSGFSINHQARYQNVFYTFEKMLSAINAKLDLKWIGKKIHLQVLPITDYSKELQLNNDYNLALVASTNTHNFNHIIALGKGELQDRIVLNIFKLIDGTYKELNDINDATLIPKMLITNIYDYSSNDSVEDLKTKAIDKLKEMQKENTLSIEFDNLNVEIGDIVGAEERVTGIKMKKQITKKIVKSSCYSNSSIDTIEYKVGD